MCAFSIEYILKKLLEMEVQVISRPPSSLPLSPNSAHLSLLSATHPDSVNSLQSMKTLGLEAIQYSVRHGR